VVAQFPVAGSYSSALARPRLVALDPPATRTLPLGSKVAVSLARAGVETARAHPSPARWVVQFRTCESIEIAIKSPCSEDFAIGQQRRSVSIATGVKAPRNHPSPNRRVVQFRTRETVGNTVRAPCNKDLAVG
jgi:hypothetical protein